MDMVFVNRRFIVRIMRFNLVAVSAALIWIVTASCTSNKGQTKLVNKAKETITRAVVLVCGQTIELKSIQPTKSAFGFYEVKADSHYDVKVEFQSGSKLHKEIGYVTNGKDFQDEVIVTEGDIQLTHATGRL